MPLSLQDQLKKTGLIDEKKAKQLKRAKAKQEKLARKSGKSEVDQAKIELERAKAAQIEKDRQLNLEKNRRAERVALAAQIKQLIAMNVVPKDGEQKFSFTDDKRIKHIYVSQTQIDQLSRGTLAIVTQTNGQKQDYVLVPMGVAKKIEQRDGAAVVFTAKQNTSSLDDDPYADFQIPDDLTW